MTKQEQCNGEAYNNKYFSMFFIATVIISHWLFGWPLGTDWNGCQGAK